MMWMFQKEVFLFHRWDSNKHKWREKNQIKRHLLLLFFICKWLCQSVSYLHFRSSFANTGIQTLIFFFILKFCFLWWIFNLPRPNRLYSLGFHHRTVYDQYILDLRTSADCPDRGAHPSPGWVELGEVWSADHNCQLCNTCLVFFGAFFCSANFRHKNDRKMSNHTNWQCCKPLKI